MSTETKYEHPGEWLPGDQVTDDEGRVWTHSDYGAHFEVPDATWMDHFVDQHIEAGRIAITHLVPRDEPTDQPPTLPNTEGWVRRAPGDVIEAGTPYVFLSTAQTVSVGTTSRDYRLDKHVPGTYWTPPPAPSEPWSVISTDRDKPTDAYVNGVPGRWYRDDAYLIAVNPSGGKRTCGELDQITHVELLHTHNPVTHVPVERALIDEAARLLHVGRITGSDWRANLDLIRALASLASDESSASDGGRS